METAYLRLHNGVAHIMNCNCYLTDSLLCIKICTIMFVCGSFWI